MSVKKPANAPQMMIIQVPGYGTRYQTLTNYLSRTNPPIEIVQQAINPDFQQIVIEDTKFEANGSIDQGKFTPDLIVTTITTPNSTTPVANSTGDQANTDTTTTGQLSTHHK